jgi:hypothetical protein
LSGSGRLSFLTLSANFFEGLLLLGIGFLMPRASSLELYLAAPEELTNTIGVRVLYAAFAQEPMSLRDGGYLSLLHGLLELLEGFGCDQLLTTAYFHPACRRQTTSGTGAKSSPESLKPLPGWSIPPT